MTNSNHENGEGKLSVLLESTCDRFCFQEAQLAITCTNSFAQDRPDKPFSSEDDLSLLVFESTLQVSSPGLGVANTAHLVFQLW